MPNATFPDNHLETINGPTLQINGSYNSLDIDTDSTNTSVSATDILPIFEMGEARVVYYIEQNDVVTSS